MTYHTPSVCNPNNTYEAGWLSSVAEGEAAKTGKERANELLRSEGTSRDRYVLLPGRRE
jgi:hypothetical protein